MRHSHQIFAPTDCCADGDPTVHNLDLCTTGCFVGYTLKFPGRMHSRPSTRQPLIIPLTLATSLSRANGLVMISMPCSIPSLPATTLSA